MLAQWSGECEIQTAYIGGVRAERLRRVTGYARGTAESIAVGWRGEQALVRLPRGEPPSLKPGSYLVDPVTMRKTLVRGSARRGGC